MPDDPTNIRLPSISEWMPGKYFIPLPHVISSHGVGHQKNPRLHAPSHIIQHRHTSLIYATHIHHNLSPPKSLL
ncbi:hypothetical protein EYR38_004947 [Pleurotus pulmonarius]|nr:hypothetical protein EYR38_004947 [Pleurotus pulmonarius]